MFLVFACHNFYPDGGWNDLIGQAPTVEAAKTLGVEAIRGGCDRFHVVDLSTLSIVEHGHRREFAFG